MSLAKINNFANDDTDILAVQTTVDALYNNSYSLTEYDSTTVPAIAAGSKIEVNGSLYRAATEEAISTTDPVTSSTVADGTVYICMIPSGDASTCTAAFTATAPTWSDSKQGWYGTGGQANYKYLPELTIKATSAYKKHRIRELQFPRFFNLINGTTETTTLTAGYQPLTMITDLLGEKTSNTEITISYSGFYNIDILYTRGAGVSTDSSKSLTAQIRINTVSVQSATHKIYTTDVPIDFFVSFNHKVFLNAGDIIQFYAQSVGSSGGSIYGSFSINMI